MIPFFVCSTGVGVRMAKSYGGYGKVIVVRSILMDWKAVYSHNSEKLCCIG